MKLVVADRLAIYVDSIYRNSDKHSGPTLILATVFFAFQIYCDFAGYSSIAIGASRIMGIHLMTNFRRPYLSKSVTEFWRRWHISLSTWFKDYVYISLGGNRSRTQVRVYLNLFITFLISGFWHGANWTFVMLGRPKRALPDDRKCRSRCTTCSREKRHAQGWMCLPELVEQVLRALNGARHQLGTVHDGTGCISQKSCSAF